LGRSAFSQHRVFERALELAVNSILTFGKHTVTGLLTAGGKENEDWSAAYRIFERGRVNQDKLFDAVLQSTVEKLDLQEPLYISMDDTITRKVGKKVAGTSWKRDPLGPKFHTNFVWGQRYLQISAALPDEEVAGRARGIPIDFCHAPTTKKPRKNAPIEEWNEYKKQQKECKVSTVGASRLLALRNKVRDRKIVCAVDGGFTNMEVFTSIPENTVLIGRIRKDASLFGVPDVPTDGSRGRRKYYGDKLPTPEEVRQDETIPWQNAKAYAAGKIQNFDIKMVMPVRWKSSKNRNMALLVIRPLGYRLSKNSKTLYRDPAYLLCSDCNMTPEEILQAYIWRWEIEVNFRDEKTIMGVGEAQVRTENAVKNVPSFLVAVYAFLLLSAHNTKVKSDSLPSPKWYNRNIEKRCSTQKIVSLFRMQHWGLNAVRNKNGFTSTTSLTRTHFNFPNSLISAICHVKNG